MKKIIYSALAIAVLVGALGAGTASAHENGENKEKGDNGNHFGFFHNMNMKFFQRADISKEDRKDKDNEDGERNKDNFNRFQAGIGRVTKISGDTIVADSIFGKTNRTWTINTDSDTTFMLQNGNDMKFSQIKEGDIISFKGDITIESDFNFTVDASSVKDWGDFDLQSKAKITGTVKSIDDNDKSLIITTDSGETVTVNVTDRTVVKDEDGKKTDFADIDAGAEITLKGFWNSVKDLFTAFKIKITS